MNLFALTEVWNEIYTAGGFWVGVIGLVVGVAGFWIAIAQIRETRKAAEAARDAANKTLAENKEAFERFVAAFASRLLSELQRAVSVKEWSFAAIRAQDLAELLGTLPETANRETRLVRELRIFGQKFSAKEPDSDPKFAVSKWNTLLTELHTCLDQLRAPFRASNRPEEAHDLRTGTPPTGPDAPREDPPRSRELG